MIALLVNFWTLASLNVLFSLATLLLIRPDRVHPHYGKVSKMSRPSRSCDWNVFSGETENGVTPYIHVMDHGRSAQAVCIMSLAFKNFGQLFFCFCIGPTETRTKKNESGLLLSSIRAN